MSKKNRQLTREEVEAFGAEVEALRKRIVDDLNENDIRYIRKIRSTVRWTEAAGRGLLFAGILPPAWIAGTALLSVSKILENMELGHNVMHGQFDWTHDPEFRSQSYEWDNVCPSDQWRHSHNYMHHTYTNIVGMDRDVGYGILRLFPEQKWHPGFLLQPLYTLLLALAFEWGVALHDLEVDKVRRGEKTLKQVLAELPPILRKIRRQTLKDYVIFPLLAGPFFLPVLAGNFVANLARNLWAFAIIFCGHFTENAETFPASILETETRAQWYLRQLLGSSNLEGGPLFHILSGNLSHQIEHHMFPDIPANRYAEMAVEVRAIAAKYGQNYNTGSFSKQFLQVMKRIFRFSLPGGRRAQTASDSMLVTG